LRKLFVVVVSTALLASCTPKPGTADGKDFAVTSPDESALPVLLEAAQRGKNNALLSPFTTISDNGQTPLYKLWWGAKARSKLNFKKATADQILDKASFEILSTAGMSPFYDYCFGRGNHAESATQFCTVTLIDAMKAHRAQKERAAEATQSSIN